MDTEPKCDPDAVWIIGGEEVDQALSKNNSWGKQSAAKKKKNRSQQQQKKGQGKKKQNQKQQNKQKENREDQNNNTKSVLKSPLKRKCGKRNKDRKASFKK